MKKKIIFSIVFLFLFLISYSQEYKDTIPKMKLAKYAIGVSPSAFLNIYEGFQVSQDFRILNRLNFTLESAYIFGAKFEKRKTSGFRFRPVVELVISRKEKVLFCIGMFGLYRYISEDFSNSISYNEGYRELFPITRKKILKGGGMSFNWKIDMDEGFFADIGIGFGSGTIEVKDYSDKPLNKDRFIFSGWSDFDREGVWRFPIVFINFNFSYVIQP